MATSHLNGNGLFGWSDETDEPESVSEESCPIIGLGAEYLVAADLALSGYHVSPMAAGASFDLLVQVGSRSVRVQVKSCGKQTASGRNPLGYHFFLADNGHIGFDAQACDVLALVARDTRGIVYMAAVRAAGRKRLTVRAADFSLGGSRVAFDAAL